MSTPDELRNAKVKCQGKHLNLLEREGWEFASRTTQQHVVAIVAITDDDQVVLVVQDRKSVAARIIELPAGLAGDSLETRGEPLLNAAQRELLEETGYSASRWTELPAAYSSAGLTDEVVKFFLAEGLEKTGEGGGVPGEDVSIVELPLGEVLEWFVQSNLILDSKLVFGISAAVAARHRRN
jgi:ADP-ribose pyrophosphatase